MYRLGNFPLKLQMKSICIFSIIIMVISFKVGSSNDLLMAGVDDIEEVRLNYLFSLFGNKKIINKEIVITERDCIVEFVESVKFNERLKYINNAMKRKPDIMIDLSGKGRMIKINIWDDGVKMKYACIEKDDTVEYYEGIDERLEKKLLYYYEKSIQYK